MNRVRLFRGGVVAAALLGMGLTTAVVASQDAEAEDAAEAQSSLIDTDRRMPGGQVVRPFNLLDDLDAEQEAKLKQLRQDHLLAVRELEDAWLRDSLAVLSDEQTSRLEQMVADREAEAAALRAQRRAERQAERDAEQSEDSGDGDAGE